MSDLPATSPPISPPDDWRWFLRDIDGHFSSRRLLAYVFAAATLAAIVAHADLDTVKTLAWLTTGFAGLATCDRIQPRG